MGKTTHKDNMALTSLIYDSVRGWRVALKVVGNYPDRGGDGMKTKHTPGPWRVCGLNVACDKEMVVASCYKDWPESVVVRPKNTEECLANARLIAAAPDLLAACRARLACDDDYDQGTKEWHDAVIMADEQMRQAITAATGE